MRLTAIVALLVMISAGALAAAREQGMDILPQLAPWPLLLSSAVVFAASIVGLLVRRLCNSLAHGDGAWQRRLRNRMGAEQDEPLREFIWAKWMLISTLLVVTPLAVLRIWGLDDASEKLLERLLGTGIQIGEIRIVPGQLLLGMLAFAILVSVFRWLSHRLEHQWLVRTPLEPSLRESVATLFGYTAFVVSILIGLGIGGVDLTKFAIIAGALSVGIGFGLQNIVNNFVSGLILLFERPVRSGDFINVGATEGYVRKVRIRATEISTLDNQNVIVPNSDILSNHVTNWMLRDNHCRITVSVGVAYGSDTALVRSILLEIAEANDDVLGSSQTQAPAPVVWFADFGASSLDFQIKCYVRNVVHRHRVASELRFAIDAAFREHGVTIPFPQRDLWLRNAMPADDSGQA